MVVGIASRELAKITGSTPERFTLIGRWLDCPPYILRPTTRLAYCTGIRRQNNKRNYENKEYCNYWNANNPAQAITNLAVHQHFNAADEVFHHNNNSGGGPGNNTRKQQHGNTVANAVFVNFFTQPYAEHCAGGESGDNGYRKHNGSKAAGFHNTVSGYKQHIVTVRFQYCQGHCGVALNFFQFFSAFFAFFRKLFQSRYGNCKQLNYNAGGNVRRNGQGEQGAVLERAAGHNI